MTKICPKCGAEVQEDALFCPVDGYRFKQDQNTAYVWIIIVLLLAIILALVFYLAGNSGSGGSTQSGNVTETEIADYPAYPNSGQEIEYRKDNPQLIDVMYERSGSSVIKWQYVYDKSGSCLYRMREISVMDDIQNTNSGDDKYKERRFWILDEPIENCIQFTIEYYVMSGPEGSGSLLVRTSDSYDFSKGKYDNWRDLNDGDNGKAVLNYSGPGDYIQETFKFDTARDIWAFSCSRSGGPEGSGYGQAAITRAWIADYSVAG